MDQDRFFEMIGGCLFTEREKKLSLNSFRLESSEIPVCKEDREDGLLKSMQYDWYDGRKKIAMVSTEVWKNDWVSCFDFVIIPSYRRRGIGSQIVEFLKRKGLNHLSVHPNNKIAIALYRKHGFVFTGEKDQGVLLRMELKGD